MLTIPRGRDPPQLRGRGAEGATSPEPLRHPGPRGRGSSGATPRQRGTVRAAGRPHVRAGDPSGGRRDRRRRDAPGRRALPFAGRHIGPAGEDQAKMLAVLGYASLDDLVDAAVPASVHSDDPAGARRRPRRGRGARRAAGAGRPQPGAHLDDRPRLPRHGHPAGDPAQRAGEPGLVHGVHAVPAGDLAGPARGAAQLPDRWSPTSPGWPIAERVAARRGAPRPPRR